MLIYTEADVFQRMNQIQKHEWDYLYCATGFWEFVLQLMRNHNLESIGIKAIDSDRDGEYTKDIYFYKSNVVIQIVSLEEYSPEAYETISYDGMYWC